VIDTERKNNNLKLFLADFHIHSKYSRATSRDMDLDSLYKWGKIKGINVIGTGDFTHPDWQEEIKEKLEPAEDGLFMLKKKYSKELDKEVPVSVRDNFIRFILTSEISSIYKKNDRVRKVHSILIVPSFKEMEMVSKKLEGIGNIHSDGRPILGLDVKDLLKLTYDVSEDNYFIPAHIWTPWFSLFGSKSCFDSIFECFDDYSKYITAVETGLSSDPFMNWRLSGLDGITLISNSDAHSPRKLGREANVFNCDLNYKNIIGAMRSNDERFIGTIEFFPEEGKYHMDGHRKCNFCCTPDKTRLLNGICPVCKKSLTVGVDFRVNELADRVYDFRPKKHKSVEYIIPLAEVCGEILNIKSTSSKGVMGMYMDSVNKYGSEFDILRNVDLKDIENEDLRKGIKNIREGNVSLTAGYDGVFGIIKAL
jgi:uncharacterized protein (TIGR00375 family)